MPPRLRRRAEEVGGPSSADSRKHRSPPCSESSCAHGYGHRMAPLLTFYFFTFLFQQRFRLTGKLQEEG